jgi:hypothetical protein
MATKKERSEKQSDDDIENVIKSLTHLYEVAQVALMYGASKQDVRQQIEAALDAGPARPHRPQDRSIKK